MSYVRFAAEVLPKRLREQRESLELTQKEVAARCGLKECAISFFELGTRSPSTKNLVKLCLALDTEPSHLFIP